MILLGKVKPYGTGGSWFFSYGDRLVGNYEEKAFLKEDYGTSAKAKAAALKYQKDICRAPAGALQISWW